MSLFKSSVVSISLLSIGFAVAATSGPHVLRWNPRGAAEYMDGRQAWWQQWPKAKRDHETVCVSCHTTLPYALSRPLLRREMGETEPSAGEQSMLASVEKRVDIWDDTLPSYENSASGPTKGQESRGTEAILDTLILASYDATSGKLSPATQRAFKTAWDLQIKDGDDAGAWAWLDFGNGPWEAKDSRYHGAAMQALATGLAPERYRERSEIQPNLSLMISYLRRKYDAQPLINKVFLLWASAKLPGLLMKPEQVQLANKLFARQQPDGGWSLTSLGTWTREDDTALETKSDGYATGMVILALEQTGFDRGHPAVAKGVAWLTREQRKDTGAWEAFSVNLRRDRSTDIGRFMDDAATGYAVIALANSRAKLVAVNAPVTTPQNTSYPATKPDFPASKPASLNPQISGKAGSAR